MKHLQLFDNFITDWFKKKKNPEPVDTKYKIGDYVFFDPFNLSDENNNFDYYAIIVGVFTSDLQQGRHPNMLYIVRNLMNGNTISHISERNIDRLLTPEEIEEFEFRKSTNTYNL